MILLVASTEAQGTKCAVGCLIPDDIYSVAMEGWGVHELIIGWPALSWFKKHEDLLASLQYVHDGMTEDKWPAALRDVVQQYGLSPLILESFKNVAPL